MTLEIDEHFVDDFFTCMQYFIVLHVVHVK